MQSSYERVSSGERRGMGRQSKRAHKRTQAEQADDLSDFDLLCLGALAVVAFVALLF